MERLTPELKAAHARIKQLELAIRTHRDEHCDDRCWLDDQALYAVLGEPVAADANAMPPRDQFLANCARFYDARCKNAGWPSYQDLRQLLQLVLDFHSADTEAFVAKHGHGMTTRELCDRIRAALAPTPEPEEQR